MAKIIKTLRNNWKKSVLFSIVGAYGVNYGIEKFKERELMRSYCKEALAYGEITQSLATKPYHVTVILNPAAHSGKARNKFENFCEPLLHLAGIKVSIVRTESNGQAKDILELLEEPNAVLVAGGDGTLMEVVTGMVRRNDANSFCGNVILGVLPVGYNNFMAKTLFPPLTDCLKQSNVSLMADATMSVVRQLCRPIDVMEIQNVNEDDADFHGKKLHGLRQIQLGAFRDSQSRINNYWILPGIKKYIAHIFSYTSAAKHIMWNTNGNLETKTQIQVLEDFKESEDEYQKMHTDSAESTWWNYLFYLLPSRQTKTNDISSMPSVSEHHMQTVTKWQEPINSNATELTIQSNNDIGLNKEKSNPSLKVTLGPEHIGFQDFIDEAWKRQWNYNNHFVSPANDAWKSFSDLLAVKWQPPYKIENEAEANELKLFYLDDEPIEIHGGMEVTMLPNKIKMFCAEGLHIQQVIASNNMQGDAQKRWWQRKSHIQSKTFSASDNINALKQ